MYVVLAPRVMAKLLPGEGGEEGAHAAIVPMRWGVLQVGGTAGGALPAASSSSRAARRADISSRLR